MLSSNQHTTSQWNYYRIQLDVEKINFFFFLNRIRMSQISICYGIFDAPGANQTVQSYWCLACWLISLFRVELNLLWNKFWTFLHSEMLGRGGVATVCDWVILLVDNRNIL